MLLCNFMTPHSWTIQWPAVLLENLVECNIMYLLQESSFLESVHLI